MAVRASASVRRSTETAVFGWADPTANRLLRGFDEKFTLTERRRAIVGDISGGRRPHDFITSQQQVHNMPISRHAATLRLRRLERKVLIWQNIWSMITAPLKIGAIRFRVRLH